MPYFYAPQPLRRGVTVRLEGEEGSHLLKSRRLRVGDSCALQDPAGARFRAEVVAVDRRGADVRAIEPWPIPALPALRLTLLLAAVKDKALEWALQKATELGVAAIDVFPSQYSPVSGQELASAKLLGRWERIAREACKQCDRQWPPELRRSPDLAAALAAVHTAELRLCFDHRAKTAAADLLRGAGAIGSAAILVGPEGGLSGEESALATGAGFRPVSLGALTLRAETAALAAAALLLFGPAAPGR
jgi:16S rRNA (uracil1498-N3)-methyltransferase